MITGTDLIIVLGLGTAAGWFGKCAAIHIRAYRQESQRRKAISEWRGIGRNRG